MKIFVFLISSCVFGVSCETNERRSATQTVKNERQAYYDRVSDAPLDVYCYIDNNLETNVRMNICGTLGPHQSDNLTADLLFTLQDGKLRDIEAEFFSFDSLGYLKKDTANYDGFLKIFKSMDSEKVSTLRMFGNGDFALRLQLERFCIGQVHFFEESN